MRLADRDAFLADCLHGLSQPIKTLPCKWLYDARGSALFEEICTTPEYYLSRTETVLLEEAAPWLAQELAPDTTLVEFGSGASRKTRLLLDAALAITRYIPIDISAAELARASRAIGRDYPRLAVHPRLGDFTAEVELSPELASPERLGFFPGSTLGNFTPPEAIGFLSSARRLLGPDSRLLLGVDLRKGEETLRAAYDDAAGVTAAFNLNLLERMQRELGADMDAAAFRHRADWNCRQSRVEMHLVSLRRQRLALGGRTFDLDEGETIHTENSYKLAPAEVASIFRGAGWSVERRWASEAPAYELTLLRS